MIKLTVVEAPEQKEGKKYEKDDSEFYKSIVDIFDRIDNGENLGNINHSGDEYRWLPKNYHV